MANDEHVEPRSRIDLTYLVKMTGSVSVYSGFARGMVDRTVVRGLDGLPYLPASTLKGRVRDMAERLAKSLGIPVCMAPNPQTMCSKTQAIDGALCLVCRTFGTPGQSSRSGKTGIIWRDARLCDTEREELDPDIVNSPQNLFYERTQVQLSRPRGVALTRHLFTSENTIEALSFKGRIRGWVEKRFISGTIVLDTLVLLCAALKLLNFVGGGKSRGLGHCAVDFVGQIEVGDKKLEPSEVLQHVDKLGKQ